jgi:P-type Ca2+ transporter type 2C
MKLEMTGTRQFVLANEGNFQCLKAYCTQPYLSYVPAEWVEGFAVFLAVFVVIMVTTVNNYNKEQQFAKLNRIKDDKSCSVTRDGKSMKISVFDVLVGDLLQVEIGDEVCAVSIACIL